jgi:hypothetical protein
MAEDRMTLLEVLRKGGAPPEDLVRSAVQLVVRELMEAEVSVQIEANVKSPLKIVSHAAGLASVRVT